jgi:hypothetical protein
MKERVTAVFESEEQAENALTSLRQMGIPDSDISIIARHIGSTYKGTGAVPDSDGNVPDAATDTAANAGTGLLAGAGIGALFGLAAVAIPGIGPFITAGALVASLGVAGGGAAAGAIVGGTAGAVAGALAHVGYNQHDADFYAGALEKGAMLVAVDFSEPDFTVGAIRSVLESFGGLIASAPEAIAAPAINSPEIPAG